MPSIFTRIIRGEIPSYKVAEDDRYYAFLDINPLTKGHTLVVPKVEVDYIFDLDDDTLAGMMVFARKVAKAIESVVPCKRIGIAVIGLEVPHAHIHLVPINGGNDIEFSKPKLKLSPEELKEIAQKIAQAFLEKD
jgi:histidine triad (HIT) family protein